IGFEGHRGLRWAPAAAAGRRQSLKRRRRSGGHARHIMNRRAASEGAARDRETSQVIAPFIAGWVMTRVRKVNVLASIGPGQTGPGLRTGRERERTSAGVLVDCGPDPCG